MKLKDPKDYAPFRMGTVDTGKTGPCPCGVKPRNQHTLSQSAACDNKRAIARLMVRIAELQKLGRKADAAPLLAELKDRSGAQAQAEQTRRAA